MIVPATAKRVQTLGLCIIILKQCFGLRTAYNFGPLGHIHASKQIWKSIVRPGDTVIDATCGNGHDSLFLATLALTPTIGRLFCIDIQPDATLSTRRKFETDATMSAHLQEERVRILTASHETFPDCINQASVRLICYNLGYLPGVQGNQPGICSTTTITEPKARLITKTDTTLNSLNRALPLIQEGGLLSVVAYPGHEGGEEETEAVKNFMSQLDNQVWRVYGNFPLNRPKSPVLISAFKIDKTGKK